MAREKKPVHRVQMTDGKRNTIRQLLEDSATQEYQNQMNECQPLIFTENEFRAVPKERAKRSNVFTDEKNK
ncbi:hypothetical protein [Clostridium sp. E02]|uniref:hypothetical protein n=1 Tax=Clostridium sp. E02 TaxID=2487134 RepID=UPI000F534553|nr:hypothetical protein [Clostridium sp. E02]